MKKILLFFLLIFLLPLMSLQADATIDLPGHYWITYTSLMSNQSQIFVQEYKDGQWNEPLQVTNSLSYNVGPTMAVMPDGSLWVAWSGFDNISTSVYAKSYQKGKWSEEYRVSLPDAYEDTQPCLDIMPEGQPVIVWAGNDGQDDEILFASFQGRAWSEESQVNLPNQTPDIDPCLCAVDGKILMLWSGFDKDSYRLFAAEKKANGFSIVETFDMNDFDSQMVKGFPSLISRKDIEVYYYSGGDLYSLRLDPKEYKVKSSPVRSALSDPAEKSIRKLPLKTMQNMVLAFHGEDGQSHTINLGIFMEKIRGKADGKSESSFFQNIKNILFALFPKMGEAYAVTANKNTAFGDSITKGIPGSSTGGYPPRLSSKLGQEVVNRGVSGERTDAGLKRINSVLNGDDPEKIFIMEGTNDINQSRSTSSIIFNLREMINRSNAHGTRPYIATLIPNLLRNDSTVRLNAEIRTLAASTGTTLADQETAFAGQDLDSIYVDNFHPNDTGYEIIAQTFLLAISPSSNSGSSSGGGCGTIIPPTGGGGSGLNMGFLFFVLMFFLLRRTALSLKKAHA